MSAPRKPANHLGPRFLLLRSLMLSADTGKDIADQMGITIGTQKIYAHRLYEKLELRDRVDLMAREITDLHKAIADLRQETDGSAGAD